MKQSTTAQGIFLTTSASLLWGTVFVAIGIGLRYVDPYSLLFMRFLVSAIPIAIIGVLYEKRLHIFSHLKRPTVWFLALVYLLGFITQYSGQSMSDASDTTLISNMAPIMAPVGAYFLLKERVSKPQVFGLILGVVGLVFIALPKLSSPSAGNSSALGDALLFITSIAYTVFIVSGKKYGNGTFGESLALVFAMFVFTIPFPLYDRFNPFSISLGFTAWGSILWAGIPCTLVAIMLYLVGLNKVSVTVSSMLLLLQVIFGLILARLILSENLSYLEGVGAILIFVSVLLASVRFRGTVTRKTERESEQRAMN